MQQLKAEQKRLTDKTCNIRCKLPKKKGEDDDDKRKRKKNDMS